MTVATTIILSIIAYGLTANPLVAAYAKRDRTHTKTSTRAKN